MGKNLHLYECDLLHSFKQYFRIPKYHAGLRIWIPAYDGWCSELVARLVVAMISMAVGSYALACFCDPAAWVTAAVFTGVSYLFVMKDIRRKYERPETATSEK